MTSKAGRIGIVVALTAAVVAVFVARKVSREQAADPSAQAAPAAGTALPAMQAAAPVSAALPRLLDLGSTSCIPCKMMAPILEQLKTEQAGRLQVDFIDVWKDEAAGQRYGVSVIPCQIFFDASGKELWRHEGFLGKDEILAKWKELGVELPAAAASQPVAEKDAE